MNPIDNGQDKENNPAGSTADAERKYKRLQDRADTLPSVRLVADCTPGSRSSTKNNGTKFPGVLLGPCEADPGEAHHALLVDVPLLVPQQLAARPRYGFQEGV